MADGMGCECAAHHESDCVCDGVDWTSSTEIALRAEIARLTEQCNMLLSRPAYAAGYGAGYAAGIAFATHRAAAQIEKTIKAEREACALACENHPTANKYVALGCRDAIRARGEQ